MSGREAPIAIIPARGRSKRLPQKNVALFKGKTLIDHTIVQAMEAGFFGRILVSSDDEEILKIARKYPVEEYSRESRLAEDNTPILEVLRHLIIRLDIAPETVIGLLQVTAPLRTVNDIRMAYDLFKQSDQRHAVVSVAPNEHPIHLSWRIENNRLLPVFPESYERSTRKQDHVVTYYWNDAVIFDLAHNLLQPDRNLFGKTPIPYVMEWERSINIDYPFQLELVQLLGEKILKEE